MKKIGLVLVAFLFPVQIFALTTVVVDKNIEELSINPYLEYFIDKTSDFNIQKLATSGGEALFQLNKKKSFNPGDTIKPLWIRFSIDLSENQNNLVLELDSEVIQYIDAYYIIADNKPVLFSATGFNRGYGSKDIPSSTFAWDLSGFSGTETTFYFRLHSETSLGLSFFLLSENIFIEKESQKRARIALISGFSLALIIYQIVIGFFLKSKEFILLGLLIFTFLFMMLFMLGPLLKYYPFDNPTLLLNFQIAAYSLSGLLFSRFSRPFSNFGYVKKLKLFGIIEITFSFLFFCINVVPLSTARISINN